MFNWIDIISNMVASVIVMIITFTCSYIKQLFVNVLHKIMMQREIKREQKNVLLNNKLERKMINSEINELEKIIEKIDLSWKNNTPNYNIRKELLDRYLILRKYKLTDVQNAKMNNIANKLIFLFQQWNIHGYLTKKERNFMDKLSSLSLSTK